MFHSWRTWYSSSPLVVEKWSSSAQSFFHSGLMAKSPGEYDCASTVPDEDGLCLLKVKFVTTSTGDCYLLPLNIHATVPLRA